jgi:hypothetical protein
VTLYRVAGPAAYMGHKTGEKFEAELDPEQEKRALERGSIKVVKRKPKDEKEEDDDA